MITTFVALMISAGMMGCSPAEMTYEDSGAEYSLDEAQSAAEAAARPAFMGESVLMAEELRQEQLTALRAEDGDAAELAALLTDLFPDTSRSVPYYAEAAVVDGTDAWIVAETWGVEGESMDQARVWVLERGTGRVILSATFR